MARGWEREPAVSGAAGVAKARHHAASENVPDQETLRKIRKRETIQLSRVRVIRELKSTENPRYRALLEKALTDLDAQLKSAGAS